MIYFVIGLFLASAITAFYLFKFVYIKTKMRVDIENDKLIFKSLFHAVIIPVSVEIKFIIQRTTHPVGRAMRYSSTPAVEVIADTKKLLGFTPFQNSRLWNPKFRYYEEFSKFISDLKESNFPVNLDLVQLEDILSKPIERTIIFSKDGAKYDDTIIV